jgi:hypothetical protein
MAVGIDLNDLEPRQGLGIARERVRRLHRCPRDACREEERTREACEEYSEESGRRVIDLCQGLLKSLAGRRTSTAILGAEQVNQVVDSRIRKNH